jgi:hypothetical protein
MSTTPIRDLADRVFAHRLDNEWYLRLRKGLPVDRLRVESEETWAEDARYAEGVLAELRSCEPTNEDDRLTQGFLTHLLNGWVERMAHPLLA